MEFLIPLAPFIMVIAIVGFSAWQKRKAQQEIQTTLRTAIEKGQSLPADVIEAMSAAIHRPPSAARDMRLGVLLLATGLGITVCGLVLGYFAEEARYGVGALAAVPTTIGLAFIVLSFFNKNKD